MQQITVVPMNRVRLHSILRTMSALATTILQMTMNVNSMPLPVTFGWLSPTLYHDLIDKKSYFQSKNSSFLKNSAWNRFKTSFLTNFRLKIRVLFCCGDEHVYALADERHQIEPCRFACNFQILFSKTYVFIVDTIARWRQQWKWWFMSH